MAVGSYIVVSVLICIMGLIAFANLVLISVLRAVL